MRTFDVLIVGSGGVIVACLDLIVLIDLCNDSIGLTIGSNDDVLVAKGLGRG